MGLFFSRLALRHPVAGPVAPPPRRRRSPSPSPALPRPVAGPPPPPCRRPRRSLALSPAASLPCPVAVAPPPRRRPSPGLTMGQQLAFSWRGAYEEPSPSPSVSSTEAQDPAALRVGIIGFGNFGQFITRGIQRQGHAVLATSRSDYSDYCSAHGIRFFRSLEALCEEQPDGLLVCSSILSTESVVRATPLAMLRPDTIVADVLSVKQFPRNLLLEICLRSQKLGLMECLYLVFVLTL
ncbi:arogenate dehydrogenase 2, chloroplastic-like [Triticum urartu]|uniref:arogenate dehydrogenase 2, chloroplastic-like n=1 Tax=Triticum urartu TaxID=4572 RepID=UPI002043915A|nr:arogenate dehydrogenase 2, chloroplastic-like [Triticum urartu]